MEPGPSTMRPYAGLEELTSRFESSDTSTAILTTPEGELLGVVRRSDLPQ